MTLTHSITKTLATPLLFAAVAAFSVGCAKPVADDHGHAHTEDGGHSHAAPEAIAITDWSGGSELFMEHPPLVAGTPARFAIHVTELDGFEPLSEGRVTVVIERPGATPLEFPSELRMPGIFGAEVSLERAETVIMSVRVESERLHVVHELGTVTVFDSEHDAIHALESQAGADDEGITFLKEQQWTLDFGTAPAELRPLQATLEVPGTIAPAPGATTRLGAPARSRVMSGTSLPAPGQRVRAGEALATLVAQPSEGEPERLRLARDEARQELALATQEKERAARLVERGAAPGRRLEEARLAATLAERRLETAETRLAALTRGNEAAGTLTLRAPHSGVVTRLFVGQGATLDAGESVLELVATERLVVTAHVPELHARVVRDVESAELHRLDHANPIALAAPLQRARVLDPETRSLDLTFALDAAVADTAPLGEAVHVRLALGDERELLSVPESALVDDGGAWVLFVQREGETFERRMVRTGRRAGGYVAILAGVDAGEQVVTEGAYLVRLAALSTQIPSHGHVH